MYLVYKIESPSGRCYVGFTGQPLKERWRQHVSAALRGRRHPLSQAIVKYGADAFKVSVLGEFYNAPDALVAEIKHIAQQTRAYNLSAGGENDGPTGAAALKRLLAEDPAWAAKYRASLSAGALGSERHRAHAATLAGASTRWRENNPRDAWKVQYRATRVAAKCNMGTTRPDATHLVSESTREKIGAGVRAFWGSAPPSTRKRRSMSAKEATTRQHAARTPEQQAAIAAKISATLKARNAAKTDAEKAEALAQLAIARKSIDHTVRKANQKAGLAAYWTPERRAEASITRIKDAG